MFENIKLAKMEMIAGYIVFYEINIVYNILCFGGYKINNVFVLSSFGKNIKIIAIR